MYDTLSCSRTPVSAGHYWGSGGSAVEGHLNALRRFLSPSTMRHSGDRSETHPAPLTLRSHANQANYTSMLQPKGLYDKNGALQGPPTVQVVETRLRWSWRARRILLICAVPVPLAPPPKAAVACGTGTWIWVSVGCLSSGL